jgi:hypothetical protein
LEIREVWEADGDLEYPFANLIPETFAYRNALKRAGNPSHIPVKLVLNSLYGKFAQTVGKAQYYSPIWAGLITSYTRAQLLDAITDDVVCVMTDSIWSAKPLELAIGNGLGEWEQQDENRLVLAEAGLYSASQPDGTNTVWQRGFDKKQPVDIENIVRKWLTDDPTYTATYTVQRFIGMGLACQTSYPWRQWIQIPRQIQPVPVVGTTKRLPFYPCLTTDSDSESGSNSQVHRRNRNRDSKTVHRRDSESFHRLRLRDRDENVISFPYQKETVDQTLILERLEDECQDD